MTSQHPVRPAIIVGIDGSTSALAAARWAAREAALRHLPLRLVHVASAPDIRHPTTAASQEAYLAALGRHGRHWLREATMAVRSVAPDVDVSDHVRPGGAAEELIAESATARMVVLGSRGLGGFEGLRVGSVALALAEHGQCPLVVVRGSLAADPAPAKGPVLVGVDGSPASEAAVRFAFDTATTWGTSLVALHTWTDVSFDGAWTTVPLAVDRNLVAERERQLLDERMAGWQEKYPDVPVRRIVAHNRPVRALLEQAETDDAQLVVVGSRGLGSPFTAMGMGSTSAALLHYGQCPLAVVRPPLSGPVESTKVSGQPGPSNLPDPRARS